MVGPISATGTAIQRLSSLVEWYLMDRNVEVVFRRNEWNKGRLCPEFDVIYLKDGRLITERCLSMQIMCELFRLNYKYTIPQVQSCMTEQAWRYYISHQDYPEWLAAEALQPVVKRPRGRPRKMPKPLQERMKRSAAIEALVEADVAAEETKGANHVATE